jgi:hypothetical protein
MSLYRGAGGASDATDDSTVNAVAGYASSAASSAAAAADSASAANTSASAAATSASGASTSASSVAIDATNASNSASLASTYAAAADISKNAAAASAATASTQAGLASSNASSASSSASTATSQAAAASSSASAADTSATNAANSASSALAIYGNTAAMNAAVAAAAASASTATTQAGLASASASSADASETASFENAQNAAEWASTAQGAANSAEASASSAEVLYGGLSAVNAAVQTSTTNASQAVTSANNAAASASSAATSASTATTQAGLAAASAASASAVVLGNEPVRPLIKPTLLLDFANTEQLDPRVTFTRASTGTFYGTQTAKAEENLLLQSQAFNENAWQKTQVTATANSIAAPDGTTTADTLTNNTVNTLHITYQALTLNGQSFAFSVFAKKGTADFLYLRGSDGAATRMVWFNLSTGAIGTVETNITASITAVGNGWYRCVGVWSASSSASANYSIGIAEADGVSSYAGTTKDIYLWGAQLEARSAATAYQVTTTQPITNYISQLQTAASGVARFDHNPITDESLGLLIEEQRANLLLRSEEFDNASWTKTASSITANTIVAPDGALTGDALIENTATAEHVLIQTATTASNSARSFSVYAKAAGRSVIRLLFDRDAGFTDYCLAIFDLASGTVVSASNAGTGSGAAGTIVAVGNGWYRCTLTGTPSTTVGTTLRNIVYLQATSGGGTNYTGNGYSGVFLWGAQLEAGAFPTSYIQTVASQVTRAADAASMTGTNFSSWYNQAEGTMFASGNGAKGQFPMVFGITETIANINNQFSTFIFNGVTPSSDIWSGGVSQANLVQTNAVALGGAFALSVAVKTNDFALSAQGLSVTVDTSGTLPGSFARLDIGARNAVLPLNGTIRKIAYYPLRVTNAQLQGLTTV